MSRHRMGSAAAVAGAAAIVWTAVAPVAGQSAPKAAVKAFTPARTPWGDPDISGIFTNKDEQGVPFERAAEFAGRALVTDEEFQARVNQAVRQLATDNSEFDIATADTRNAGAVGSATSPPPHWLDRGKPSRRTSRIVEPADGRIPPQTPEGQKRIADRNAERARARSGRGPSDSYTDRSLYDRCITRGLPGSMMPAIYGNSYEIVQAPGMVAIRYEMVHETRVVPLDGRKPLPEYMQSYMGDSRGHWEGDTLVVEGSRYLEASAFGGASSRLRTIERFRPTSKHMIEWSITFDDATTWLKPWTFGMRLTRDDEHPIFEYACHEGNEGLRGILSAARAAEKEAPARPSR